MTPLPLTSTELIELLASTQPWQERYRVLISLAKMLPEFHQHEDRYLVGGCDNRVWLTIEKQPDMTFLLAGDSDGRIVKGLLGMIIILTQGKTAEEILALDFQALFDQMQLSNELSQSRMVGLKKIVAHLCNEIRAC